MANEKTPVVWDDTAKKHRPLGSGEKMGGLSASSMISSDSGNLLQQGSDGLMLVTGGSIADPRADNLLEESANGKLQVTTDRVVEWLDGHPQAAAAVADAVKVVSEDSGNVIVQGTDKGAYLPKQAISAAVSTMTDAQKNQLADAISSRIASDIADGQTVVASNGKLHFDPTNAAAAQKKAINQALADANSGLVVDNSTGKLGVDFSNMPTDKFEELLKGLKMKVPLASNLVVYVSITNSAAGDDIVDGRGTQAKPFKHIQAAVNYVTQTYALGNYRVFIRVVAGTYPENIALPAFDRGTGYIVIEPASGARDVIVQAQPTAQNYPGFCFSATGGWWQLNYMDARRVERPTSGPGGVGGCYASGGSGTTLVLCGCSVSQSMPSGAFGGNPYTVRLIVADDGGTVRFVQGALAGQISSQQPADMTTPDVSVLVGARGGKLHFNADVLEETVRDINCSGSCKVFLSLWQNGSVQTGGSGDLIRFVDGGVTGQRYALTGGSFVSGVSGSATFFPGDADGTVQDSTYCWYA